MAREERFSVPPDLTLVKNLDELKNYETRGVEEFERINALESLTADDEQYAAQIAEDLDRIRDEISIREQRAALAAEKQRVAQADKMAQLKARVTGEKSENDGPTDTPTLDAEAIAAAASEGAVRGLVQVFGDKRRNGLTAASLSDTAKHAPETPATKPRLSVTAAVDIPGVAQGGELTTLEALTEAFSKKAKSIPVSRTGSTDGHTVATVRNTFEHTVDNRTSPAQVEELVRHLTRPDLKDALVAGGGWCAPSEIRYDFFNISCEDGMIDLPTVGITRGGIQFPVSPSLADSLSGAFGGFSVPFDVTSNPWVWTETDDIATVTGSPNKPCVRVPCPTFDEERLECYGICLTAGNLTNDAYPEATQNMIRLLMSAHAHAMNARTIALMVARSNVAVSGGEFAGGGTPATAKPAFQQILSGMDLAATDYRAKFGMCTDDVLEIVAPYWMRNVIRADLAWRNGVDLLSVPDSEITSFFTDRNIRVQWVNDWQVRGTGQFGNAGTPMTAWPTSGQIMVFAAGTFIRGQGLSLDLGVIRDSVLNAENDYTAAWSEECQLVARVGHESRLYDVTWSVMGATTVANLTPGTNIDPFPNL